jgi:hypothetical protein
LEDLSTADFLLDFHQLQKESGRELVNQPLPCVGKEMPISRIVVAVPNATVVLLD